MLYSRTPSPVYLPRTSSKTLSAGNAGTRRRRPKPQICPGLSVIYRLSTVSFYCVCSLRPDRLSSSLSNFVEANLGAEFVEQQPFDIEMTYKETSPMTPIFFVLFPGTDPTPIVENMGRKLNITSSNGKFVNISMGQGQETIAINALNKCAKEGGWKMLQNIHLMQSWLKTLERSLELIEDFVLPDFRCLLTSEPPQRHVPADGDCPRVDSTEVRQSRRRSPAGH